MRAAGTGHPAPHQRSTGRGPGPEPGGPTIAGGSRTVVRHEFDPERWRSLEPPSPVQSSSWLRVMLSRLPGQPLMVRFERSDGELGFTGAVVADPAAYEAYNPWAILRRPEPVFEEVYAAGPVLPELGDQPGALLPSAVLVAPGYLGDPVGRLADRPDAVSECLAAVCGWARDAGLSTVCVLYTSPAATAVVGPAVAGLGGTSFPLTTRSSLPVTWASWEQFLATRPKRRRDEVKRQLRRLSESDCLVAVEEPAAAFDEILAARCELLSRYGQPVDADGERHRLRSLIDEFGPDLLGFTTRQAGRLRCCALFVAYQRTLLNVYVGGTRSGRQTRYAHLAATYHAPSGFATRERFDRIDYGVGHGETKRRQGCQALPLHGHLIPLR